MSRQEGWKEMQRRAAPNRAAAKSAWGRAKQAEVDRLRAEVAGERERCVALIRRHLMHHDQRAVSWHEVADCLEAIVKGATP